MEGLIKIKSLNIAGKKDKSVIVHAENTGKHVKVLVF